MSTIAVATVMTTGIVAAAPPNWTMTVTPLPEAVTPGNAAGFDVTITNNGASNIASLYLVDADRTNPDSPVYITFSQGTCNAAGAGPLWCSLGALNAGSSATVIVAYTTPTSGSSYALAVEANTTGVTFSDGDKKRSHGDALPGSAVTALNNNKNFAGLFSPSANGGIQNDANLSGNNKQSTGVGHLPAGIEATVLDGPGATGTCVSGGGINCNALFGEWSVVKVNGGEALPDGAYFTITIKFKTGTPTGFVHSYDSVDAAGNPIVAVELVGPCVGDPVGDIPCFTWNGVDTATIYTFHNGSWKGL